MNSTQSPSHPHRQPPPPRRIWQELGLSGNPFRRLFDEELLATLLDAEPETPLRTAEGWIALANPVLQFIGQEGYGKSTRLEACHCLLRRQANCSTHFTYVPLGTMSVSPPIMPTPAVWLLDEAQRLNRWHRRKLVDWAQTPGCRLLIGTHEDLSAGFARRGVGCHSEELKEPGLAELQRFVRRRLTFSRREHSGDAAIPEITVAEDALSLVAQAMHGNLGRAEFILYEAFQHAAINAVQMGHDIRIGMEAVRIVSERAQQVLG
ncbi:MAG TPA: hypothetical protein DEW46_04745 [Verrucomicrobia bacterium]|nr:hypothetical protein [Verrucomicrobiota bacterium]